MNVPLGVELRRSLLGSAAVHPGTPGWSRRRWVVLVTAITGTVLLGISLRVRAPDPAFLPLALALAVVWAVGALLSGPVPRGRVPGTGRRPWRAGLLTGAVLAAVFLAGALLVRQIEPLRAISEQVLDHARTAPLTVILLITLANGLAEELFFRGALFSALPPRYALAGTTALYVLATAATGNVLLVFAALILGTVVGLQRRATGGVLAPALTHLVWSAVMVLALPPLLAP